MSSTYNSRPSSILGIQDEWAAYQIDALTLVIGRMVESETASGKKTAGAVLKEMQGRIEWKRAQAELAGKKPEPGGGSYRDPRQFVTRRIAIPENGVW